MAILKLLGVLWIEHMSKIYMVGGKVLTREVGRSRYRMNEVNKNFVGIRMGSIEFMEKIR